MRPEQVGVSFKDTDSLPFDPGTGGSKQTNTSGHAVYQAAREVREKLINLAARELGCKPEEIKQDGNKLTAPEQRIHDHGENDRAGGEGKRRAGVSSDDV